ncbi:hypothetical protein ACQUSN_21065 [Streptomyces pseudogriseolus]|uniref:hypothetical protein n=1 Tax=Streptomyces pseudogriseolus TaxID=36817 RepID=UPI003FA2B7F6
MLPYDELTPPERELWDAFPEGRQVDLRTGTPDEDRVADGGRWGPERTVRAEVVTALLLGANTGQPGAVARLRLTGARISGRLDLAGAQIAHALWLEACWFEEAVNLLGASTQTLVFTGSRIPGIEADSARIEGNFSLRHCVVEGGAPTPFNRVRTALSLTDARVNGGLLLNGAKLIAPDGWALSAGGLAMEGGVFCKNGFVAYGEVRLMGAQLPGTRHARCPTGRARPTWRGPHPRQRHGLVAQVIGGLGQRTAWYWSNDSLQWLAYLLIAFGWVLTTAVIARVTRTMQKS